MKIPSHFRKLVNAASPGVLLDAAARELVATDGRAVAVLPFPEGEGPEKNVFIPADHRPEEDVDYDPEDGWDPRDPNAESWGHADLADMIHPTRYRFKVNAKSLAALAEALGAEELTLDLPEPGAFQQYDPIKVTPDQGPGSGYIVIDVDHIADAAPSGFQTAAADTQAAPVSPVAPEVSFNAEHSGIELTFPEPPPKVLRESLKLGGFRFHRRKGLWYARDDQRRRDYVLELATKLGARLPDFPALPETQTATPSPS